MCAFDFQLHAQKQLSAAYTFLYCPRMPTILMGRRYIYYAYYTVRETRGLPLMRRVLTVVYFSIA